MTQVRKINRAFILATVKAYRAGDSELVELLMASRAPGHHAWKMARWYLDALDSESRDERLDCEEMAFEEQHMLSKQKAIY
jgi:hypothetical protein